MKEYHSRDLRNFIQNLKNREHLGQPHDDDQDEFDDDDDEEIGANDSAAAYGANSDMTNDPLFDQELEMFKLKLEQAVH